VPAGRFDDVKGEEQGDMIARRPVSVGVVTEADDSLAGPALRISLRGKTLKNIAQKISRVPGMRQTSSFWISRHWKAHPI